MFPVSLTHRAYRVGKGKEGILELGFESVAAVVVIHEALVGELG